MNRCILFEPTSYPTDVLNKIGEVVYLFIPNTPSERHFSIFSKEFGDRVLDRLEDINYNPDNDFITITGDFNPVVTLTSWAASEYGKIRTLQYNAKENKYEEIEIGEVEYEIT